MALPNPDLLAAGVALGLPEAVVPMLLRAWGSAETARRFDLARSLLHGERSTRCARTFQGWRCRRYAVPGHTRCRICLASARQAVRAYQARHRAEGRCVDCPKPVEPGFARCPTHRRAQRVGWRQGAATRRTLAGTTSSGEPPSMVPSTAAATERLS